MRRPLLVTAFCVTLAAAPSCNPPDAAPTAPTTPSDATSLVGDALDRRLEPPVAGDRALATLRFEQAMAALARDDATAARTAFESAVAADPSDAAARIEFGFLLLEGHQRGSFGAALLEFRFARLVAPDDPMAICGEAVARLEVGDVLRGEPLLRRALADGAVQRHTGRFAVASVAQARLDADAGRIADALRRYAEITRLATLPASVRARAKIERAELLIAEGRLDEAADEVAAAIALDPRNVKGRYHDAVIRRKRGDLIGAAAALHIHELLRAIEDHQSQRVRIDSARLDRLHAELAPLLAAEGAKEAAAGTATEPASDGQR
ncbi:MAG: hypothetical protein EXS13_08875 [Planctomycetes bacterium]|nr:hypothetical protein [Planctomycetota bacterium]